MSRCEVGYDVEEVRGQDLTMDEIESLRKQADQRVKVVTGEQMAFAWVATG